MHRVEKTISITDAKAHLNKLKSEGYTGFIRFGFWKRGNNEFREMTGHLRCLKHLKGGDTPYVPGTYDLLAVWDPSKYDPEGKNGRPDSGYRSVNLRGLEWYVYEKTKYIVKHYSGMKA